MIELSDGSIASCSNDKYLKIFEIGNNNHKVLGEYKTDNQLWAIAKISGSDNLIIGDNKGLIHFFNKSKKAYSPGKKILVYESTILNMVSISPNILLVTLFKYGVCFLEIKSFKIEAIFEHSLFNPFKCSIQIISEHELLIGSEDSIFVIDYKNYSILDVYSNERTYSLYKLSEECLLSSNGDGYILTYKMVRKENGDLILISQDKIKIHNSNITGIILCPDGKLITYEFNSSIKIWKNKNNS